MCSVNNTKIAVTYTSTIVLPKAQQLAEDLCLPLVPDGTSHNYPLLLAVSTQRLELRQAFVNNSKPVFVDFLSRKLAYRRCHGGGCKQLIAKAVGLKNNKQLRVLDTTAGLGEDAFILATLGCEVLMLERSPIVAALLADGLQRAQQDPQCQNLKLTLTVTDSIDYINKNLFIKNDKQDILSRNYIYEVIYIDTMYPPRNKSALGKKSMIILRDLVGNDDDASALLTAALKCACKKVVVKRPRKAPPIADKKPNLLFVGKSCRYDIYF